MTSKKPVKLALVGCGNIANEHWFGLQHFCPRTQVVAAIDTHLPAAQRMAAQTGARAFATLEDALRDCEFDAVDIMLPHNLHESAALAAFAAGKHVCLEKPMSTSVESCNRILAAARQSGNVFMIAEQAQFWADAVEIQRRIHAGDIGEVITARAGFAMPGGARLSGARPWRYSLQQSGGGPTMDGGLHWLRPLRMWLGDVDEVVAITAHPNPDMEGESLTRALLRFQSGVTAAFDCAYFGEVMAPREEFRVSGSKGELVVEGGWHGRVLRYTASQPEGEVLMHKYAGRRAAFGHELREFENAVLDGAPFTAGPEYSLGDLYTAWAMYKSAGTRQWEKVQQI